MPALYPKGVKGLSLGFQPQVRQKECPALKGRQKARFSPKYIVRQNACSILGLKPQAESYYPFGVKMEDPAIAPSQAESFYPLG
jgi:hypothetical protein